MKVLDSLYRIDLAYEGRSFEGWQSQPNGNTVQDHCESALSTILRHPLRITGASRTDAGVHAFHQVATFKSTSDIDTFRLAGSLKGLLPKSIGIRSIEPVEKEFHPITSALGKAYRYRFWLDKRWHPFVSPQAWPISTNCDVDLMRQASKSYIGRHDFSSHCAADASAKTKERTIFDIVWEQDGNVWDLWVIGDGFLKQMVRTMAGTLCEIGLGKIKPNALPEILLSKDRSCAGVTAPAAGLTLVRIFYEKIETMSEIHASTSW